ncbi:MAG: MBL fold metallo-hydrolase [Deltaproteobacteria bacterium]|nr:MBL fold metallo-hydrolase [Deltaproteobacteria bacterium]
MVERRDVEEMGVASARLEGLGFFGGGGVEEVHERTWFVPAFANVAALETSAGLVLVDAGLRLAGPGIHAAVRSVTQAPLHTVIYTHGHVDHAFGLDAWLSEMAPKRPRIVAHENVRARFERYARMPQNNARINRVQFAIDHVVWPTEFFYPDTTYDKSLTLEIGGETFELHHTRGETDDATWVWVPGRKVLCVGDFWIGCAPNCGNPQKVQRYAEDWEATMRRMASLGAEVMLPGHGKPLLGREVIASALLDVAAYLRAIIDTTLEGIERGLPHDEIVARVVVPPELAAKPYLQPLYDRPEFIARNIIRLHAGWWNGRASELLPSPAADRAREIAALAGGVDKLVARATALLETDLRLACHVAEWAWLAAPDDPAAREVLREAFTRRSATEESLMARNIYRAAASPSPS